MAVRRLTVPADAPPRLDTFLVREFPAFGKAKIQQLLAAGRVKVNGKKAKPLRRLTGGEEVELDVPDAPAPKPVTGGPKLTVLHETDALVVIDKPSGLVVEPEAKHETSVVALVAAQVKGLDVGGARQPGVVHRLDKDTAGCLLFAKTDAALKALQRAFDEKRVTKTYLAWVQGTPPEHAELDQPYGRHPEDPRRYTTRFPTPRRARLSFQKREQREAHALLEIDLDTGRTHQIRAQLADLGHPLPGDWLYGDATSRNHPGPIPLLAWRLRLDDPALGFEVTTRFSLTPP
ncbi:MAG: RluA family pseudouridine synthase [Myxococcaceae bacterium]